MAPEIVSKAFHALQHPTGDKEPIEHPAHHGASLESHDPPEGVFNRLTSDELTRQIKSQGNNGQGMEGGLHDKAIHQQERVAERSRLQREGLFEPHMTHDKLTNLDKEHRDVADGTRVDFD
ncbi:hypothetical protein MNV49_007162 [Pseudohyphozyma bogoriensis]|nr:hypothetical protein MNV49_007162 [Pseudohyphozyma bogoriensis]